MSDTPAADDCRVCHRTGPQLTALRRGFWECSHVDCPCRKPITAAPPTGRELEGEHSGCWHVRPRHLEE